MYYIFHSRNQFIKVKENVAKNSTRRLLVFKHIEGIPNPWATNKVLKSGKLSKKKYNYSTSSKALDRFFEK